MKAKYKRWIGGSVLAVLMGSVVVANIAVRIQYYGWPRMLTALGCALVLAAIIGFAAWLLTSEEKP